MSSAVKLIDDFIFHCRYEKNLSKKTIKAYRIDLKQFLTFLNRISESLSISEIDKKIIKQYLRKISDGYKAKTIKRKVATIKAFFNYVEFEDIIVKNPFRKIKISLKEEKQLPKTIDVQVIKKLFSYIYQEAETYKNRSAPKYKTLVRDIAVLEILFSTGIRVSELCNLKVSDANLKTGILIINGKGKRERIIPICSKEAHSALKKYFTEFQKNIETTGYLFINRLKNRFSEQSVRFMIKKHVKEIDKSLHITPHMFRHSIATLLLENEVDIRYIQDLLGHSSINTTQIYLQVNKASQRKIITSKHPRKSLKIIKTE